MNEVCTDAELGRLNRLFLALGERLEEFARAPFVLRAPRAARVDEVVVGRGAVHVAFHMAFHRAPQGGIAVGDEGEQGVDANRRGCLMVPVRDALRLVSRHRNLQVSDLEAAQERSVPDASDKGYLLVLGGLLAEALAELDGGLGGGGGGVSFVGCQGVRAGMHPHVPRAHGEEWIVGRAGARLEPWDEFDVVAMVPPAPAAGLDGAAAA